MLKKGSLVIEKVAQKDYVVIDHPKENETIDCSHYSFRIGANKCCKVEISFDKKQWHPCRYAVGYWWYDWSGYDKGKYKIIARMHSSGGKTINSKLRKFKVN